MRPRPSWPNSGRSGQPPRVVDMKTVPLPDKVNCNFCGEPAGYDSKTSLGPWAYLCPAHFKSVGVMPEAAFRLEFPA